MVAVCRQLDDRFALLTRTGGVAPSRQRTLLASVQWSHDLLTVPTPARGTICPSDHLPFDPSPGAVQSHATP